jgi:tetratricopeptide (TPR) repeat protein
VNEAATAVTRRTGGGEFNSMRDLEQHLDHIHYSVMLCDSLEKTGADWSAVWEAAARQFLPGEPLGLHMYEWGQVRELRMLYDAVLRTAPPAPTGEHLVELEAVVNGQLGLVNRKLGLLNLAEVAFGRAAELGTGIRSRRYTSDGWLGRLWCLRAYTSAYRGRYKDALSQLAAGIAYDESLGVLVNRALHKAWQGSFLLALGYLEEASTSLNDAIRIASDQAAPDQRQLCHALIRFGDVHTRLMARDRARETPAIAKRSYADALNVARAPGRRQVDLEVDALRGQAEFRLTELESAGAGEAAMTELLTDVRNCIDQAREVGNRYVEYELRVLGMRLALHVGDKELLYELGLEAGSHEFAVLQALSDLLLAECRAREGDFEGALQAVDDAGAELVNVDHVEAHALHRRVASALKTERAL